MRFQRSCNELMDIAYGGYVKLRRFRDLPFVLFSSRPFVSRREFAPRSKRNYLTMAALDTTPRIT